MTDIIAVRIFSGPQRDAEIRLPAGAHVFGTDDSCDIILLEGGVAPRHIRLDIELGTEGEQDIHVRIFPLDAPAVRDGAPLAAGEELPAGVPCALGGVVLAWAPCAEAAVVWTSVQGALASERHSAARSDTAGKAEEHAPEDHANAPVIAAVPHAAGEDAALPQPLATSLASPSKNAHNLGEALPLPPLPRRRSRAWLPLGLALLLTAGLLLGRAGDQQEDAAQQVAAALREGKFSALSVRRHEGDIFITGRVKDDAERARLVALARNMPQRVYLTVTVGSDRAEAVSAAFNSREIYPSVWEEPHEGTQHLYISAYIKDAAVEAWAFNGMREDVPSVAEVFADTKKERLVCVIRHADAVDTVLRPALEAAGIQPEHIDYGAGSISITGTFSVEARATLEATVAACEQKLDVPLPVRILQSRPRQQTAPQGQAEQKGALPPAAAPTPDGENTAITLRVVGVTMEPMRFITLDTGERVFEGARVNGDCILESITLKELRLRRGEQRIIYPLRGL